MLQDHAFIMRFRYDEVCTVLIWNMFQKCTFFFRTAHHANLKHVSGWHMFQSRTQHVHFGVRRNPCLGIVQTFFGLLTISYFRRCYTLNQKLTCFVLYLKIIKTFLENSRLSKELKNSISLSRSSGFCVIDQNNIMTVLIRNLKQLGLLEFQFHFWVPWKISLTMHSLFSKKCYFFLRQHI